MRTETKEIILGYIKKSLNPTAETDVICDANWAEVIDSAIVQGVLGMCVDVFERLPVEQLPDIDILEEWYGLVSQIEARYEQHEKVIRELVSIFEHNGIHFLLLKGIGLSKYYPVPKHRPCGDIDIYPYGKELEVDNIAASFGCEVDLDSEKHSIFWYKGNPVENHRVYLDSFQTRNEEKVQEFLCTLHGDVLTEDGYYTPSPLKNYFFLLCHMSRHFSMCTCITLRHLLDWGCFLNCERGNLDVELIKKKLKEFNLVKCNNIFTSLAQDISGYDLSQFITAKVSPRVKSRFLNAIFTPRFKTNPTGFIPRNKEKLILLLEDYWKYKYLGITFRERIWRSMKIRL